VTAIFSDTAPAPARARPTAGALLPRSKDAPRRAHRVLGDAPPRPWPSPTEDAGEDPVPDTHGFVEGVLDDPLAEPPAPAPPPRRPLVGARAVLQNGVVESWVRPAAGAPSPFAGSRHLPPAGD
jgi:hypothetical protein